MVWVKKRPSLNLISAISGLVILLLIVLGISGLVAQSHKIKPDPGNQATMLTGFQISDNATYYFDPSSGENVGQMRPMTGDYWRGSSELDVYPNLANYSDLSVQVSMAQQRLFLKSGDRVIYVMYISGGEGSDPDSSTPTGTYAIQKEHGDYFYNAEEGEGANYYVSWLDHGVFLFHSVPTDENGDYIVSEAEKLGHEAASHGCIRLSVADSQWFYKNIPVGTPVTIE